MSGIDDRDFSLRAVREHVERTARRLAGGRERLARAHQMIDDTNRHIASMSEWIGETERALGEERARSQRSRESGD